MNLTNGTSRWLLNYSLGMRSFSLLVIFTFLTLTSLSQINFPHLKNESFTYDQAIEELSKLSNFSPYIEIIEQGKTDVGRRLHTVVFNLNKEFDPTKIDRSEKAILLINNAIHPGESCGVDATVKLFEYLSTHEKEFENLLVVAIPIYNIGGMLNRSKYSRSGQPGPVECGFRANYQHLDLNRDFIKSDALNTAAFHKIFHAWKPHLFMDTHTTNGSDHQYPLTLIVSQRNKMNPILADYTYGKLENYLYRKMAEKEKEIVPYVHLVKSTLNEGIKDFLETPRYSSGYVNLFNTIGLISEAHKYASFQNRVEYTYELLNTLCVFSNGNSNDLIRIKKLANQSDRQQNQFSINWLLDTLTAETLSFKGYKMNMVKSETTGLIRRSYDKTKKITFPVPHYRNYISTEGVNVPRYYVIPQCYPKLIEVLNRQGVAIKRFENDTILNGGMYYLEGVTAPKEPYEKHYFHSEVRVNENFQSVRFYKGDVIVSLDQDARRYLVETLEPTAADAFFRWNYFDNVLQQKEWFSDFAFDPIAKELLEADERLNIEFQEKRNNDSKFAENHMDQLLWIFHRSKYYEPEHKRYPIMRVY